MKHIITALALTLSFSAVASSIPDSIKCTSLATSDAVKEFTISGLTSLDPDSSIYDTGFMNLNVDAGRIDLGFSNECDNSYEISLKLYELKDLKAGKIKKVTGVLKYSDVPLSEARNSEEAEEESVEIVCRLN